MYADPDRKKWLHKIIMATNLGVSSSKELKVRDNDVQYTSVTYVLSSTMVDPVDGMAKGIYWPGIAAKILAPKSILTKGTHNDR